MNHAAIVKTYSDEALAGIVNQLSRNGAWPDRLKAASIELQRRRAKVRR